MYIHVAACTRGCYIGPTAILSELIVSDEAKFTIFIRMNKTTFDIPSVLGKMEPYFNTQDRKLLLAIPAQAKLAATL